MPSSSQQAGLTSANTLGIFLCLNKTGQLQVATVHNLQLCQ